MCNCIEVVNEKLKGLGCKLDVPFMLTPVGLEPEPPKVAVSTRRTDGNKRKKPITLTVPFCPFCGEKYGDKS